MKKYNVKLFLTNPLHSIFFYIYHHESRKEKFQFNCPETASKRGITQIREVSIDQ